MPAVIAPSPMTQTILLDYSLRASLIPRAALIEVLECPTPNTSYSLSFFEGKGAKPPFFSDGLKLIFPAS